jgi:hypothetical protein
MMYPIWNLLEGAPLLAQVLSLFQLAFTIWMMVDAYRRRVESFWYWVICIFQPIGAWAYFFVFKFRAYRLPGGMQRYSSEERSLSLEELRSHVNRAPTVANRFALAERLMEKGAYTEAIPLLDAVLAIESNYCAVLHALAACRLATNAAEQAVAPLEKLLNRDPRWEHYRAWRTLIEVHVACGKSTDALAACHELVKRMPTLENKCLLAQHLLENGKPTEAINILSAGLEDYRYSPWNSRWRNWHWARVARRLLEEAGKREKMKEHMPAKEGQS